MGLSRPPSATAQSALKLAAAQGAGGGKGSVSGIPSGAVPSGRAEGLAVSHPQPGPAPARWRQ